MLVTVDKLNILITEFPFPSVFRVSQAVDKLNIFISYFPFPSVFRVSQAVDKLNILITDFPFPSVFRVSQAVDKFNILISVAVLLLVSESLCEVCQAPQSESVFFLTSSLSDFYVANDFDNDRILIVWGADASSDHWSYLDLKNFITYINTAEGGCTYVQYTAAQNRIFERCLPEDAEQQRSGAVDFYTMERDGFTWLVGMKPVPDTDYFFRHFSRFYHEDVVAQEATFGVVYKYSLGISDPTIFDKDLSVCVEAPLAKYP
ncbi:hypothetical protein EGW08_021056 [Elysia chlorotica]|uniref:Uncharacterized protein n=1 Tax=Elysia chlorotica TaxID=188477 RepID=A0A3S1AZH7_ELYCH|nr:hypothetical protein EGW08_021056 [Elysia chlorotica]